MAMGRQEALPGLRSPSLCLQATQTSATGHQAALQTGQAHMQMGLQALLQGRTSAAAADSVSAPSPSQIDAATHDSLLLAVRGQLAILLTLKLLVSLLSLYTHAVSEHASCPVKSAAKGPLNLLAGNLATCRMLTYAPGWAAMGTQATSPDGQQPQA